MTVKRQTFAWVYVVLAMLATSVHASDITGSVTTNELRDAYFGKAVEIALVAEEHGLNKAVVGAVSADLVVPYPPGIPVLIPGQEITDSIARFLLNLYHSKNGTEIHGLVERGDSAAGERELQTAVRLNPEHPQLLEDLGRLYAASGHYEPAIPLLSHAVEIDSTRLSSALPLTLALTRIG